MPVGKVPNLPPELKEAINIVADNAVEKLYVRLMEETKSLYGGTEVGENTRLALVYLISLRLTEFVTKKIQE